MSTERYPPYPCWHPDQPEVSSGGVKLTLIAQINDTFFRMNFWILVVLSLLFFGGGGFYVDGPWVAGCGVGLIFIVVLGLFFTGGLRGR